jgi:hypothetical protein
VQQIKSCRRQLYRPKKLTLARLKVCFGFRSNRFRSMEHDTSKTREKLVVSIERHVAANQHNENLELAPARGERGPSRAAAIVIAAARKCRAHEATRRRESFPAEASSVLRRRAYRGQAMMFALSITTPWLRRLPRRRSTGRHDHRSRNHRHRLIRRNTTFLGLDRSPFLM